MGKKKKKKKERVSLPPGYSSSPHQPLKSIEKESKNALEKIVMDNVVFQSLKEKQV